jgi:hypothetical protein
MSSDRRRRLTRPRPGGLRVHDPIVDLHTHPAAHVSVPALAAHYGVRRETVYKWIDAGLLPATRLPDVIRVRTDDARAFDLHHRVCVALDSVT